MSEPTEQDRKTALNTWLANDHVEAIAQALADERERVLTVRRALLADDYCACENCIREELGEVIDQ